MLAYLSAIAVAILMILSSFSTISIKDDCERMFGEDSDLCVPTLTAPRSTLNLLTEESVGLKEPVKVS